MRPIFADTLYWGAVLHPLDQYRAQVIRARAALGDISLVTTDEVLTELLDGLAQRGTHLRAAATRAVRRILNDGRVTVHQQPREPAQSASFRVVRDSLVARLQEVPDPWRELSSRMRFTVVHTELRSPLARHGSIFSMMVCWIGKGKAALVT